jgi:arabinogalactan endo-1,4-beta-galactosidase
MANTTLNPSDKNAGITLSGGNLTATNNNGAQPQGVRAAHSYGTGKFYWEGTFAASIAAWSLSRTARFTMMARPPGSLA